MSIGGMRILDRIDRGAMTEEKMSDDDGQVYKSFLHTRLLVGVVGILLPTFTITWDLVSDLLHDQPLGIRGSLSAYYYHASPLRDWFVGSLWAIGVGLMVYMGTRKDSSANWISFVSGVAALVVSLFPTNDQDLPSSLVSRLHLGAAAVLLIGLAALCVGFGRYDGRIRNKSWNKIHYLCAGLIGAWIAIVLVSKALNLGWKYSILTAEVLAVYAFAISWFIKGAEIFSYRKQNKRGTVVESAPAGAATTPIREHESRLNVG